MVAKTPTTVRIPLRTQSEANVREHWRKKSARTKAQRNAACMYLITSGVPPVLPTTITLTRIAPRDLDDDNLASSFKAIRDGVADYFDVDDRDKRYSWRYDQRRGEKGEYAVEIHVAPSVPGVLQADGGAGKQL